VRPPAERDISALPGRPHNVRHVGVHVLLLRGRVQRLPRSTKHLSRCRDDVADHRHRRLRRHTLTARRHGVRPVGLANSCVGVSAYRPLVAFKTQKINDILKTSGRYAAMRANRNTNPNRYTKLISFFTNNAPFAAGNRRTANDVSCLKMMISYVLDADSGR